MLGCKVDLADTETTALNIMDNEVNALFRKGLQLQHKSCGQACVCHTHGAKLTYDGITKKEAAVLRRMLSTGPPVRTLSVCNISLVAFKVAFCEPQGWPSLEKVYVHVDCEGNDLGTSLSGAFRSLTTFELKCENTGMEFAKDVADYIRQNKSLREIVIWNSCGGDEGVAVLAEALAANDTLKTFSLAEMELSSDTLIIFAKMLATNSTLEVVNLRDVCPVEKDKVCWLMAQKRYAGVFKRLDIAWPEERLPELAMLIRRQACCPTLFVSVTSSVDEGALGQFSDALAADATLRRLDVEPDIAVLNALVDRFGADGTDSALRKTVLRQIWDDMDANRGKERHLVSILDALKTNSSIEQFTTSAVMVTPELATSLSELLTANDTLNVVDVFNYWEITPNEIQTVLKGLRANYTLTDLRVLWDCDHCEGMREIEALLRRNVRLVNKAAEYVVSGADVSDVEGADALMKVMSSAQLVEDLKEITGKTTEAVLGEIQSTLARLNVRKKVEDKSTTFAPRRYR